MIVPSIQIKSEIIRIMLQYFRKCGENLKDGCTVNSNEVPNYQNNGGDQSLKDGCHVNSNEVCNYHNDGESFHEVQSFENLIYEGDDIMNLELKNIKDHITKIETPSFPSKESLIAEFVKCIETTNSSVSKDVTHLISKQKELSDEVQQLRDSSLSKTSTEDISKAVFALIKPELKTFIQSIIDLFSKTKVNIHVPEDFTMLSPEFASLQAKIQELCSTMNDIVNFKVEISNLANKTQENEKVLHKMEREEDQQLLDVISLDQGIIKGKISKIAECMLLLVKWAKSICVDDSASIAKTIVAYEEAPLKQAEFDKDFTELPIDPESNVIPASTIQEPTSSVLSEDVYHERPQTETSLHVVVAKIHTTYAQKERKQHIVAGVKGVEHVMTSEEIAKQKEDEEIIKSKNEENKASYAEVLRVIEEEARSLQIQKKMKTNNCKSSSKIKSYFMIGVPLSELDPMIEYHGILNKRKLDDTEKEGSFVSGMDCDLSIPLELVNKDLADGQVLYEPEFGMFFNNRYRDSHVMFAEKEFIKLVEVAIEKKNVEYPAHKRIKLERMDIHVDLEDEDEDEQNKAVI
ncbi:hypothetical protein Tco_1184399 [Tanacetum coccineum]